MRRLRSGVADAVRSMTDEELRQVLNEAQDSGIAETLREVLQMSEDPELHRKILLRRADRSNATEVAIDDL